MKGCRLILLSLFILLTSVACATEAQRSAAIQKPNESLSVQESIISEWKALLEQRRTALQALGLQLADTFQGSLEGHSEHAVVLWEWVSSKPPWPPPAAIEVYELRPIAPGQLVVERLDRFELEGPWVHVRFAELNAQDINRDGLNELVVQVSTGGNCWGCTQLRLFQMSQRQIKELPIRVDEYIVPQRLADLDGDGRFEVIALNTRWEEEDYWPFFCHACTPAVEVIYTWQNGQYVEASQRFSTFYESKITELEQWLGSSSDDEIYLGASISLLLNYIQKGEAA